jgi:hypothetical protein
MKCDKAQEFFSDYIENTLDRPMTVALEAHLTGCESCGADVASLRSMWIVLDKVPQVEPPADFVWQTTTRLQNEFLNRQEAQRAKPLPWWKRITPVQTLSYGAVAALLAVGLWAPVVPSPLGPTSTWDVIRGSRAQATKPLPAPVHQVTAPRFDVEVSSQGAVTVTVAATSELPTARIWMGYLVPARGTLVTRQSLINQPRTMAANDTFNIPLRSGGATAAKISVLTGKVRFEKCVILPGSQPVAGTGDAYLALQQLANREGRPLLVDAGLTAPAPFNMQSVTLQQVLEQTGARATVLPNNLLAITK